ncbi:MAG: hypothetical protein HY288_02925 [Planctomycetia bacterium]|nr:hypothetical protein [Planctomycetia bacterium]
MRLIRRERNVSTRRDTKRRRSNSLRRANTLEVLEGRLLLAATTSAAISPWHNSLNPLDVNRDNRVTPKDVLLIINDLLAHGTHAVGTQGAFATSSVVPLAATSSPASSFAVDVNGDGTVSPKDLIMVINQQAIPKLVRVFTFATDMAHNHINSIAVGQSFLIETDVQDIRSPVSTTPGVFATFDNVTYANSIANGPNLASIAAGTTVSNVNFDPFFVLSRTADFSTPGQINGIGAAAISGSPPGNSVQKVWNVLATANSAGLETFTPSFNDTPNNDGTLLYGLDNGIVEGQIDFVGDTLQINALPAVSVASTSALEGNAGPTLFFFTVSLSTAASQPVTVAFQTADGTGPTGATVANNDYVPTSGTLTLTNGQPAVITVTVNGDTVSEPDETFTVNLLSVTSNNAVLGTAVGVGTIQNDDLTPALSIADVTVTNVGSGSPKTADFIVNLSAPATTQVTVNVATSDVTAVDGVDYTGTSGTLTFNIGDQSKPVSVPITPDPFEDDTETFKVTLSNPTNATLPNMLQSFSVIGTIMPAFAVPTLSITNVSLPEGTPPNQTTTNFVFMASLSNSPGQTPVVVHYATADGASANLALNATVADNDYIPASGDLTFSSSVLSLPITVTVVGDTKLESSENFTVNLTPVTGATGTAQGVGTIQNDDGPPTLTIGDVTVIGGTSGTTNAVFTVSLSAVVSQSVFVGFSTQDGTAVSVGSAPDFITASGQLTFAPNGPLQQFITVPIIGDPTPEENETFSVVLSSISGGTVNVGNSQATGTIIEQGLTISDAAVPEGNPGQNNIAVFTVTLSAPQSQQVVTVNFSTADGTATLADSDYGPTSGQLTFTPGVTTQTISVPIIADTRVEGNETFFVNLSRPVGSQIFSGTGTGTILNDDGQKALIRLQLSKPLLDPTDPANWLPTGSVLQVNDTFLLDVFVQDIQGAPQGILSAYLNALYDSTLVSVNGPIAYGSHFTVAQSGSTSTPGQIVEAGATSDNLVPPAQQVPPTPNDKEGLLLSVPLKAIDVGLANFTALPAILPSHPVLEYLNDQAIPASAINFAGTSINIGSNVFAIDSVSVNEGNNGQQTQFVFNVTRFLPGNQSAMVEYSTSDGTATTAGNDYVAKTATLTFAAGDATPQPITILVNGDMTDEPDETFFVKLRSLTLGVAASSSPGVGTILNDDPHVALTVSDATAKEGQDLSFTLSLAAVSGKTVTVAYNTADLAPGPNSATAGLDYTATSGTVTFMPGETQKTITVHALTDNLPNEQPSESFLLVLGNSSNVILPSVAPQGHIVDIPPASLSGSVYVDINNDGIRQTTEVGIANVPITAILEGTSTSQTTLTKADGSFTFIGLQPGNYTLKETQPGFFVDGKDTYPTGAISLTNDQFSGIPLIPSQAAGGFNFGEMGLRTEFAAAFFNRRAFFSSAVVTGEFGPPATDTAIDLRAGNAWVSFDGGWQGQRTIQALFDPAQGSVTMTLYDLNLNQLAVSTPTFNGAQLQFNGTGVTYFLKLSGTNSSVSLKIDAPALAANLTQPQSTTSGTISTSTSTSSPPTTDTGTSTTTSGSGGVTSTFASSALAAPSDQPLMASGGDLQLATDAALSAEDDWVTNLLAA